MGKQAAKWTQPPATGDGYPANAMVAQAERGSKRWDRHLLVGFSQRSPVVPGHPMLGIFADNTVMFHKGSEVVERICFDKTAGMDQAHEQIADESAALSFKEQRIFSMDNGPF